MQARTGENAAGDHGGSKGKTLQFPGAVKTDREDGSAAAGAGIDVEAENDIEHAESTSGFSALRRRLAGLFSPGSRDQRRSHREPIKNLVASFWTGGPPAMHAIRDISATGLFVVTTERWYLGTVIRMTLTKADVESGEVEDSICVCAEAVRWGNDGVGLKFLLNSGKNKIREGGQEGADREQLDRFLKGVHG
jgi:hypothetical protein